MAQTCSCHGCSPVCMWLENLLLLSCMWLSRLLRTHQRAPNLCALDVTIIVFAIRMDSTTAPACLEAPARHMY